MESVFVPRDGCGSRPHISRPDVVGERCRSRRGPSPRVDAAGAGASPDAGRRTERLGVLTALGLALVTSTLSFGFILGGNPGGPATLAGAVVEFGARERSPAGGEPVPSMSDAPATPRRRPEAAPPGARDVRPRARVLRTAEPPSLQAGVRIKPSWFAMSSPALRSILPTRTLPTTDPTADTPRTPDPSPADAAEQAGGGETPSPRRMLVRTPAGRTVVARVHGGSDADVHVMLPDGQIGIPDRPAYTDDPFAPAGTGEVERDLLDGPFAGFQTLHTPHYLILYQGSEAFAGESATVLENLYRNLTDAFRKFDVPVREAEFPLVAVIFGTEEAFRAHKPIDPEVQAYYEIYSNRIHFYETSERDELAPEVAALRRPQTVAHEGTHQILANIGVQPRLAAWPPWLTEGLAEYCSTPLTTRKGTSWSGLGMVNPLHLATIRDLADPLSGQVAGSARPEHIGRKPGMPLVEYLATKTELTPTDYALSWAMTHYLAKKRVNEFVDFLRTMSRLPPLRKRTPDDQLAAFRRAFGADLGKLDRQIDAYLGKLKVHHHLPYYAVMFEQRVGGGLVKRAAIVSQSPSMIRQWLETVTSPRGAPPVWEAVSYPIRTPALVSAADWVRDR